MPDKSLMVLNISPPEENSFAGVKDKPEYARDHYSKAIILHRNEKEIQEHLEKKKLRQAQAEADERLNSMEQDISDIKSLLKQLINKM